MEKFKSEASLLAWENFKATGKIGYYSLFKAIESAEIIKTDEEEFER